MKMIAAVAAAAQVAMVHSHGRLEHPRSRQKRVHDFANDLDPPDGPVHLWHMHPENYWYNQGCMIGCDTCDPWCNPECTGAGDIGEAGGYPGPCCSADKLMAATNPGGSPASTWNNDMVAGDHPELLATNDPFQWNPWRAPGFAPVMDPCGMGGGARWNATDFANYGTIGNDGEPPAGYRSGWKGTELPVSQDQQWWHAGSVVEVSWSPFIANHGGGYQYRLCPADSDLSEECFQRMPLQPATRNQYIQYHGNYGEAQTHTRIDAVHLTEGVHPAGSTWIRNPFPPCLGLTGGEATHPCDQPMFPPPPEMPSDWFGYGISRCQNASAFGSVTHACSESEWHALLQHYDFGIVDEVIIPNDLAPGKYVMSWRWDVEQSPQIWANCADVNIMPPLDLGTPAQLASIPGNSTAPQVATGLLAVLAISGALVWFVAKRVTGRCSGEDSYGLMLEPNNAVVA